MYLYIVVTRKQFRGLVLKNENHGNIFFIGTIA